METILQINKSVLNFVTNNLSPESQKRITEQLFNDQHCTKNAIARNREAFFQRRTDIAIGDLNEEETQLFVIIDYLSQWIAFAKEKQRKTAITSVFSSQGGLKGKQKHLLKIKERVDELEADLRVSYHHLNSTIWQTRKDLVEAALSKHPHIYKKIYDGWSSGFAFEIVAGNKITLVNQQMIGGD